MWGGKNLRCVNETPEMYSQSVRQFVDRQAAAQGSSWVKRLLAGEQERERVVLRDAEFILVCQSNKRRGAGEAPVDEGFSLVGQGSSKRRGADAVDDGFTLVRRSRKKSNPETPPSSPDADAGGPWLAIVADESIRTLRDLRGAHVPMLTRLLELCLSRLQELWGVPPDEVAAYVHYPPNVYHLHVHFVHPLSVSNRRQDVFRVHWLQNVIQNLTIDSEFYAKTSLQVAVHPKASWHDAYSSKEVAV